MFREIAEKRSVRALRYVPVTVILLVGVSLYFEVNGIRYDDVYPTLSGALLLDPVYHAINAFLHFDRAHFTWNMRLLIPFGIVLTWLTSNRHVLVVVVFAQLLANVVSGVAGQFVFGASSVTLALVAAALVRSIGYGMQNASTEAVQAVVGGVLAIASMTLFVIFLASGGTGWIAHFHHFLGFTFGGAIEAIYLFSEGENEESADRGMHRRVAR